MKARLTRLNLTVIFGMFSRVNCTNLCSSKFTQWREFYSQHLLTITRNIWLCNEFLKPAKVCFSMNQNTKIYIDALSKMSFYKLNCILPFENEFRVILKKRRN